MARTRTASAPKTSNGRSSANNEDDSKWKWTVMVFMGADNVEGTAPLADAAAADIAEMAAVGSGGRLNIFVEVHNRGTTRRGQVRTGTTLETLEDVTGSQASVFDGATLGRFLQWALGKAQYDRRADSHHYSMLVLWGHAYEFAIGHSPKPNGIVDALDFAELSDALLRFQQQAGPVKLDILGFDACDLATVEMACQMQPFAQYLLGSQLGIPIPGWPYDRILDRLRNPKGRLMVPAEFGAYIVRRFCESYTAASPVSLTLLDLDRADHITDLVQVLALALAGAIDDLDPADFLSNLFLRSQTMEGRPYVDVADLCVNLMRGSAAPFVIEAARAVGDFLVSPRPPLVDTSTAGNRRPFVLEHGRNAGEAARLNGISLYAPHVTPGSDVAAQEKLYHKFVFAQTTAWSTLVHTLAGLA
jgi:hypothetical protein